MRKKTARLDSHDSRYLDNLSFQRYIFTIEKRTFFLFATEIIRATQGENESMKITNVAKSARSVIEGERIYRRQKKQAQCFFFLQ